MEALLHEGNLAIFSDNNKIKSPAVAPKKNSEQELDTVQYAPCLVKLGNNNEIQQQMNSVHGIKDFVVSVVPTNEIRKEKRMHALYVDLIRLPERPSMIHIEKGIKNMEQHLKDDSHLIKN